MAEKISLENKKAEKFELQIQDGSIKSLESYKGRWLILYFYPKDNTPGCTVEAKDFTCLVDEFKKMKVSILGVSKDNIDSHKNFISDQELGIDLASDEDTQVHKLYEAWGMKMNYGKEYEGVIRSTLLISPDGFIAKHWRNVRAKGHADRVLKEVKKFIGA